MKVAFSRQSLLVVLLSFVALFAIYLLFGERSNLAQLRPAPSTRARFAQFSKADAITTSIRDRSKEMVRVDLRSVDDRLKASRLGTVVQDLGNQLIMLKDRNRDVSRTGIAVQRIDSTINLPGAKFDPLETPPTETVRPSSEAAPA